MGFPLVRDSLAEKAMEAYAFQTVELVIFVV